ncbi:MAG: copper resistance system multicopper oxidase [Thermodesulfobacteriota bacterium]|nr:copper resistance system multicopper oxidase [Thermodesulfobacteriota bacterium]
MNIKQTLLSFEEIHMPRRQFVKGMTVGGALLGLGLSPIRLLATSSPGEQPTLRGKRFDLTLAPQAVNFTGKERVATTVNGLVPGPVLRWREGDRVTLNVSNLLAEQSSIHWHGIILPSGMDGVPDISFKGIGPGETFSYQFDVRQNGTFWYHSHSGFQEQTGMYGAIIIDPLEPEPFSYDREYVILLSDWSDEDPGAIYAKLKKMSGYYNFAERTTSDLVRDIKQKGVARTWAERSMWNRMRMSDRDLSDVTGYTYTFLMNGQTPAAGWTGLFKRGDKVRLRFINGSAMSFFDVRIPGMTMTVVAADGQNIEPVSVDEFRIGVAETYDVIVAPKDDRAYCIFAQALDRTGYARGTLTPDPSLRVEVPGFDPYPILTHQDMGMDMSTMSHYIDGKSAMTDNMVNDHEMHSMKHSEHAMAGAMAPMDMRGPAGHGSNTKVIHAETEFGPHVDARAQNPQYRLDDPGVGLRNNGRKVLSYADLRNLYSTPDPREPEREIQLHLTGNMARYMWSINGVKYADAEPLQFKFGERLRITFVNDTMMNHPMHLHGMWSDLETGDPNRIPRKHTVIVQPGSKISYLVTADAMGSWAYHCHLLYHMLGMFRKVIVS